ncbi:MAG: DUF2135 domain-containing protein [Treponemataceae bacterium]|nr:DUF2135 domain-containing protein [Treponemataceae bacterium]
MKKFFSINIIILLFLIGMIYAQPSKIKMTNARLSELSVEVEVMGNIATTKLDMIFVNETNRILEGEFEFPLGEGETVTGYALDINGKMRQGVVVEKDKGRQVFETIVRQNVDPGLIEKTSGNNFKTRIYPLPANGSRHVQITYQSRLLQTEKNADSASDSAVSSGSASGTGAGATSGVTAGTDRKYVYSALPSGKLDSFSFRITVRRPDSKLNATLQNGNRIQSFSFTDSTSGYTGSFTQKNVTLTQPFEFVIPQGMLTGGAIVSGANGIANTGATSSSATNDSGATAQIPVYTQDIGKDTYFYYFLPINGTEQPKKLPEKLTIWWDISSSGAKRNIESELNILCEYVKKLKNPTVTVYPFCNELHEAHVFKIKTEKDISFLETFIRSLDYDGATKLDYDFTNFGGDEILVFTDGIGNWTDPAVTNVAQVASEAKSGISNASLAQNITNAAPSDSSLPSVYTINSSSSADHAWLSSTAQKNGGQYINLCSTTCNDALKLLTNSPYRLIKAEYDKTAVTEIYPENSVSVKSDFEISGILKKKEAVITLFFGHGNTIEKSEKVNLSISDGVISNHVARQWASMKIDALSADYERNKTEITELAKSFGIVTQDTSLIVLDTVQDYVRYGIVPPDDLKEEYNRLVGSQGSTNTAFKPQTDSNDKTIPSSVYKHFEEFRKWWNTTPEEFKAQKQALKKQNEMRETTGAIAPIDRAFAPEPVFAEQSFMAMDASDAIVAMREPAAPTAYTNSTNNATDTSSVNFASSSTNPAQSSIQLQAWSPNAEYLSVLKRTPKAQMYTKYLELKKEYSSSPSFYMEVSDYFVEEDLQSESIRILSNLAELNLENTDILRALVNKLVEHDNYALAVPVFEKLVQLKPEIPQFHRDLGMAYSLAGEKQKAVDTLYSVAYKKWDSRFDEVQQIALNDMNAIIAECQRNGIALDLAQIDNQLIQNFDVDVRIILTWNTDDCDIDLWVTDKDGEKCYYGNRLTANGGRLSRDFTQGYGPEEFCIHTSPGGKFMIQANYFANHQQKLLQPVSVQAEVYTNFGRENQKRQVLTLELKDNKETFLIGTVE